MTALDTSSLVAYLAGERGPDVEAADAAIAHKAAVLPPVVLAELLSAPGLAPSLRRILLELPLLDVFDGYWQRAGDLRGRLRARGCKARFADALIAQSCLDHHVGLITRDRGFRHFAKYGGLALVARPPV